MSSQGVNGASAPGWRKKATMSGGCMLCASCQRKSLGCSYTILYCCWTPSINREPWKRARKKHTSLYTPLQHQQPLLILPYLAERKSMLDQQRPTNQAFETNFDQQWSVCEGNIGCYLNCFLGIYLSGDNRTDQKMTMVRHGCHIVGQQGIVGNRFNMTKGQS